MRAIGASVILGNTYHLHFRPGEDVIEELGGLHAFSGWDGPILTDSGGFQVFSLRDTLLAVDDDGVTFRSVYDGASERFTPEGVAEIQRRLGSDIAMCLDICPPADASRAGARGGGAAHNGSGPSARSTRRARRGSCASGSPRAAPTPSCGARSIEEIVSLGFDGYALGGLAVGESREEMLDDRRLGGAAAPGRQAAVLHGHRRHRGHPRRRSRAGSTCSTACCRPARRARARR